MGRSYLLGKAKTGAKLKYVNAPLDAESRLS